MHFVVAVLVPGYMYRDPGHGPPFQEVFFKNRNGKGMCETSEFCVPGKAGAYLYPPGPVASSTPRTTTGSAVITTGFLGHSIAALRSYYRLLSTRRFRYASCSLSCGLFHRLCLVQS
eukprot:1877342-Rhodomonas_salina.1